MEHVNWELYLVNLRCELLLKMEHSYMAWFYRNSFLDFKLSPRPKCCMLSSWQFPGVWILYADGSEHSVCSVFIGGYVLKMTGVGNVTLHNLFLYSDPPLPCHPPSDQLRLFSSQTFSHINTPTFSTPLILHTYLPMKVEHNRLFRNVGI